MLLGAAILARCRYAHSRSDGAAPLHPLHNKAVLFGAALPDLSLFVMWAVAKLSAVPDRLIWSEWYYSATWQQAGAVTNSIPIYLAIAIAVLVMTAPSAQNIVAAGRPLLLALSVFALAALSHVLTDLPLHHDDGHPHFWPISNWVFASPVSYWDPRHYGDIWSVVEVLIGIVLVVILWRRFQSIKVRALLLITLVSYAIIAGYWYSTLG